MNHPLILSDFSNSRTDYGSLYKEMKKNIRDEMTPSEKQNSPQSDGGPENKETNVDMSKYAADGVYFRCPLLGWYQILHVLFF